MKTNPRACDTGRMTVIYAERGGARAEKAKKLTEAGRVKSEGACVSKLSLVTKWWLSLPIALPSCS